MKYYCQPRKKKQNRNIVTYLFDSWCHCYSNHWNGFINSAY